MNKLKIYTLLLAIMTTVAWFSVVAQTTDSGSSMTTTTTNTSEAQTEFHDKMHDSSTDNKADNQYVWIGLGIAVVIAGGAGIYFVRRSKNDDSRPQTGSDINNPASGI